MKNRIHEWDFFKGFLIIMIILGHVTASLGTYEADGVLNYCSSLTVSFIMPLFLIITGYFIYPQNTVVEWKKYIKKKMVRCLFPALKWGMIGGGNVRSYHFDTERNIIAEDMQKFLLEYPLFMVFICNIYSGINNNFY